jgi:hypothetical protein
MSLPTAILPQASPAQTAPAARSGPFNGLASLKTLLPCCVGTLLAAVATTASALPGTFQIDQIYSDAAGLVQFVVIYDRGMRDCDSGEALWAGQILRSSGGSRPDQTFVFPTNLPTCATSDQRILIASQAFAALGIVAPDYVIPNGFIPIPNGALNFAGVSSVAYTSLPNDGITAILAGGTRIRNLATNLAGRSASVAGTAAFAINPGLGGTWFNPATPGQGFMLEVVPSINSLVIGWFTWSTTAGDHFWMSGLGPINGDSATVELQRSSNGLFNSPAAVASTTTGTATFRFTDCSRATVTSQRADTGESGTIPIVRLTPVPAGCSAPQ